MSDFILAYNIMIFVVIFTTIHLSKMAAIKDMDTYW